MLPGALVTTYPKMHFDVDYTSRQAPVFEAALGRSGKKDPPPVWAVESSSLEMLLSQDAADLDAGLGVRLEHIELQEFPGFGQGGYLRPLAQRV